MMTVSRSKGFPDALANGRRVAASCAVELHRGTLTTLIDKDSKPFRDSCDFAMATLGAFAFGNATQGWFVARNRWYEVPFFLAASLILFYPAVVIRWFGLDYGLRYVMYLLGLALYAVPYLTQRLRRPTE